MSCQKYGNSRLRRVCFVDLILFEDEAMRTQFWKDSNVCMFNIMVLFILVRFVSYTFLCAGIIYVTFVKKTLFLLRMGKSEFQSPYPSQHMAPFPWPQPPLDSNFYPSVCAGVWNSRGHSFWYVSDCNRWIAKLTEFVSVLCYHVICLLVRCREFLLFYFLPKKDGTPFQKPRF